MLRQLAAELVKAGQLKRAKAVNCMIKKNLDKTDQLLEVSWLKVESVSKKEPETDVDTAELKKVEELCELGIALARDQQWEQAKACWLKAETLARGGIYLKPLTKAEALLILSTALAQTQQWEYAETVIRTIKESSILKRALRKFGVELAKAQQWERAEAVANAIGKNEDKAAVLTEMVKVMEQVGENGQILRLIQRSWQQADTKLYAVALISLITSLIALNPQIIPSFCTSFTWIDTFLEK